MLPLRKKDLCERVRASVADDPRVRLVVLFGSYARDRARPDSDVDIVVDAPGADLLALSAKLSGRLGVEVDAVSLETASIPMLEDSSRMAM